MATYLQSLLGEDEFKKTQQGARNMGLLQAGLAGLMASGPSLTPTSAGQALGAAGLSGLTGYQDAMAEAERQGLQGIEFQQMQQDKQSDEAFKAALPQVFQNGKINYQAAQQLALAYPEKMGQVMSSLKSAQPPKAPTVDLQFDPKTGTIFNKQTGKVTYAPGFEPGQVEVGVLIPDGATPAQAAEIYRKAAQKEPDSAEAKRLFDLANAVDPESKVKPPTDAQSLAAGFWNRMTSASPIIDKLEKSGDYPTFSRSIGATAGNFVMTPKQQQYQQAAMNWVRANLRKESGAVIGEQEAAAEYANYFPMLFDSPEVIKQKRETRKRVEEAMKATAGETAIKLIQQSQQGQQSVTGGNELAAQARAERERRRRQRGQ